MTTNYRVLSKGTVPYWPQGNIECGHKPSEYLGSFEIEEDSPASAIRVRQCDVHLSRQCMSGRGLQVCIRYSNYGPDYYSPGSPSNMVQFVDIPEYAEALKLILDRCCESHLKYLEESCLKS